MIGYLKGEITHVCADFCFINVGGVGYRVFVPESTRKKLAVGQAATLFTYLSVREDALMLYGFGSQDDYNLFALLISVSGIGPKGALVILSSIAPEEFCLAVAQKNIALLTQIQGIGKKSAERIILELKDKLADFSLQIEIPEIQISNGVHSDFTQEAIQALSALGYSQAEIIPVVRRNSENCQTAEELIKAALKEFARGK